jgi:hypothetical protein
MEFDVGVISTEHMQLADTRFLWLSTQHTFTDAWIIKYQKHKPLLWCFYGPEGSHLKGINVSAKVKVKFIGA